jgi:hypothetical protein
MMEATKAVRKIGEGNVSKKLSAHTRLNISLAISSLVVDFLEFTDKK